MKRRLFLQSSACGLGLVSLSTWGCSSLCSDDEPAGFEPDLWGVGDELLVFGANGTRYHLDPAGHRVRVLDGHGHVVSEFGKLGGGTDELNYPLGAAVGPQGHLYLLDFGNCRVVLLDEGFRHIATVGQGGETGELEHPTDLALAADGTLYVSDAGRARIQVFGPGGKWLRGLGAEAGLNHPRSLTLDSRGNLHVVDAGNARVVVFSSTGKNVRTYGRYGAAPGELLLPRAVRADGAGHVFVADPSSGFISAFDEDGGFLGRFLPRHEDGSPAAPLELSVTPSGRLHVWSGGHLSSQSAQAG